MRPEFVGRGRVEHLRGRLLLRSQVACGRRRLLVPCEKHDAREIVADLSQVCDPSPTPYGSLQWFRPGVGVSDGVKVALPLSVLASFVDEHGRRRPRGLVLAMGSTAALTDLPLRCRCGRVRGLARAVSPRTGLRFSCYCHDCQAFIRFLERPDVVDAAGGTDIFQMAPARLRLSAGAEALRCLRLSDRGVLRWYTDCCHTPVANTADRPRFPIVAVIHSFMDHEGDGRSRDQVLGQLRCRLFERSAVAPLPPKAPPPPSFGVFARRAGLLLGWWMRGLAHPSPFFDERTGAPRAEARLLTNRGAG